MISLIPIEHEVKKTNNHRYPNGIEFNYNPQRYNIENLKFFSIPTYPDINANAFTAQSQAHSISHAIL